MDKKNADPESGWTLVIRPKTSWFDLHLQDIWRYRDLVAMFVKRDFVSMYKQTVLGPLWFIIQPMLTTVLYLFMFTGVAHISTDKTPPVLFYLSGLTVWNYFSTCLNKTSTTFLSNSSLFGKVYFPRLTAPVSIVISSLLTFFIQLLFFIIILAYYMLFRKCEVHIGYFLMLIPYLVILMACLGLGAGIIISSLTTKYRDLANLIGFGVQLLMYMSAVVYPLSLVTGKLRILVLLSPMTSIVAAFRYAFFGGLYHWHWLAYSTLFTLVVLFTGILLFNKVEKNFMDTV